MALLVTSQEPTRRHKLLPPASQPLQPAAAMLKKKGAAKAFELEKLPVFKQAKQLMQQDEWKQAVPMFERALKKVPAEHKRDRATCLVDLPFCHLRLGDELKAATATTEEDNTYGMGWCIRGDAHYDLEQFAEAVTSYDTGLEAGGLTAKNEASAQKYLQFAKDALAAELAAAPAGGSASGVVPEEQRQQAALGQPAAAGRQAAALAFENVGPTEVPNAVPEGGWRELPALKEANRLFKQERWPELIEQIKVVLAQVPKSEKMLRSTCYIHQTTCFHKLGKLEKSLKAAVAATEERPDSGTSWSIRGGALHDLKRWLEAVHNFGKALEVGDLGVREATVRNDLEDSQRRLLWHKPKDVVQHKLDYKGDGKREFQRKEFQKALTYCLKGSELLQCIITTQGSGGRTDKCLELGVQLKGNCALMHMQLKQFVEAKQRIEEALKYDQTSNRLLERQQQILSKMQELGLEDFVDLAKHWRSRETGQWHLRCTSARWSIRPRTTRRTEAPGLTTLHAASSSWRSTRRR